LSILLVVIPRGGSFKIFISVPHISTLGSVVFLDVVNP
jgi:hypothetical protein